MLLCMLCCRYSEALLVLLRQFSESGVLVPTAVNPDVLQQEVQQLLDTANLNRYYAAVSSGCGQATQRGFVTDEETVSNAADAATGVTQVKVGILLITAACWIIDWQLLLRSVNITLLMLQA